MKPFSSKDNSEGGMQNQEGVPDHLRKQLAVAVRSVQWSYAIFWSLSTKQQGKLEWGDGYYNGDIKTRKTVREMEIKPDKMGLQRSEQLRELYEFLLEGESDQQTKKAAALSPDDLSDAEWYYMVCMSFVFNQGQSLPGKALATNKAVWLCNAHSADSKVFSRSLLAKSASIKTVVCFPYLGGVIELGVTDLVPEDPSLIQHIKASLLEFSKPVCSEKSSSAPHKDDDADFMYVTVNNEEVDKMVLENFYSTTQNIGFDQIQVNELERNIQEEFTIGSPDDCSTGCEHNNPNEDSFLLGGINGGASQVQSLHFMDNDLSNCVQDSKNSSDCISQAFVSQENPNHPLKIKINTSKPHLKEVQECNHTKLSSLDLGNDQDLHYQKTLSAILINKSHRLLDTLYSRSKVYKSSFARWTKQESFEGRKSLVSQQMVKKILINVPLMHSFGWIKSEERSNREDGVPKRENADILVNLNKKMENEKFLVLRSMVPTISKIDKGSILGDTIEYLKELEARVEELESCIDLSEHEERTRKRCSGLVEKISDNCESESGSIKKTWLNKRKASDIDESSDPELSSNVNVPKDGSFLDLKVSVKEKEVLVEMRCPWREHLLLDIMDALNNLDMDAHSVQSSTNDGILKVTLQSKFRGAAMASDTMINSTLSTIAGKC